MRAIVTGGAGFIGSHLGDFLVEEGHKVTVIDDLSYGKKENVNKGAELIRMDIRDKKIKDVFEKKKPEIVFHLAAQKNVRVSVDDPCLDADINIIGSLNLLENCRQQNSKVIFTSTGGAIYGDTDNVPTEETQEEKPVSPYGVAKLALEKYLHYYQQTYGLSYTSLRLSNVYGPRQDPKGEAGVVAVFLNKLLSRDQAIINGDGKQTRDYVFVEDVVKACLLAMEDKNNGIYNIGTSIETDVNELFENIVNIGGFDVQVNHGPALPGEQMRSCLSYQKAEKELSWQPNVNFDEGLKKTIDWFIKNNKITK